MDRKQQNKNAHQCVYLKRPPPPPSGIDRQVRNTAGSVTVARKTDGGIPKTMPIKIENRLYGRRIIKHSSQECAYILCAEEDCLTPLQRGRKKTASKPGGPGVGRGAMVARHIDSCFL